jgi:hypothetical protein
MFGLEQAQGFEKLDSSQKEIIRLLQVGQTLFTEELMAHNEVIARF